jgi:uncharacterized LabA/DUF88 family protein
VDRQTRPKTATFGLPPAKNGNALLFFPLHPIWDLYIKALIYPAWFAQRSPRVPARGVFVVESGPMTAVSFYIDGFNLYHALLEFRDDRAKWLDLRALCGRLIRPKSENIVALYYFSAYADWLPGPMRRHQEYVKGLRATGVTCVMGHFKKKDRRCFSCNATWIAHEEKETDVSIGITMLNDAYKNVYEKAYLVTRDSDLMPTVKMILAEFRNKMIVAVAPPYMGHSTDLITVCHEKKKITPAQVWSCLFPQHVKGPDGSIAATRPTKYD